MQQPQAKRQRGSDGGAAAAGSAKDLCWFYEMGWCTEGGGCKWSHDLSGSASARLAAAAPDVAQQIKQLTAPQDAGLQAAVQRGRAMQNAGMPPAAGMQNAGVFSEGPGQMAPRYQQPNSGMPAQPMRDPALDGLAIVPAAPAMDATTAGVMANIAGYDEQTLAALYQYLALQAGVSQLMAQASAASLDGSNPLQSMLAAAGLSNPMGSMSGGSGGGGGADYGAGDAAVAAGVATARANYKMQLCKFYGDGKCVKGSTCPYAHGNEEILAASLRSARVEAAMKEGSKNDVCFDFRERGKCRFGITCKFSHNIEKL